MKWLIELLDFRLWNGAGQGGGGAGGGQGGGGAGGGAGGSGAAGGDPGGPGEGGMGQGGGSTWGGDNDDSPTWGFFGPPKPEPVAPPPPPVPGGPGWEWAANRQVANIDRTSQYTHEQYTSALETIHQQSLSSGAGMGPGAYDYELPDTAFGERIY